MAQRFANAARGILASAIAPGTTTIEILEGGDLFPVISGNDWFKAVLQDEAGIEIIRVNARTGNVFTVVRGQEGTTARAFSAGTTVGLRITAADMEGSIATANNSVQLTGDQTIGGAKTFSNPIVGSTNTQVSLTGDQTVGGIKTFTSNIVASGGVQGNITGNAATATALQTARTINGVAFNGSANITIADSTKLPLTGGTLTGALNYQNVDHGGWARGLTARIQSSGALAAGIGFLGSGDSVSTAYLGVGADPWTSGNGVRVTTAGVTISGATTFNTLIAGSINGNAGTATTLQTARNINGVSFNGSANITLPTVNTAGDQSVDGVKTFTSQIVASGGVQGNVTGNAGTVTNGVYTTGDQTIGGVKTFSSAPRFPNRVDLNGAATAFITNATDANWGLVYRPSQSGNVAAHAWQNGANSTVARLTGTGNFRANGDITADGQFLGNGAGLTSLPAAQLAGDVAAARITNALNATGSAPIYACRAWVNFNGTGTVAIRASGNVSSITDNGVGDYTVNFTNAMPDVNYSVNGGIQCETGQAVDRFFTLRGDVAMETTSYRFRVINGTNTAIDCPVVTQAIFR